MSGKKRQYNKMVKQPKLRFVYGCVNPDVINGSLLCDGNCSECEYQTIERTFITYKK